MRWLTRLPSRARRRYSASAAARPAPSVETVAEAAQHDLQRRQQAQDVGRVVVAEVGDAEDLALQLALAAGDRGRELGLQRLHDRAGVDAGGRVERGERVAVVARGHQRQPERLRGGAGHGRERARVAHERVDAAHAPPRTSRAAFSATTCEMAGVKADSRRPGALRSRRRSK